MANLTFADLENEVYAHANLDSTDTATQTNVDRWLNYTQQDLCSRWPWPFMESRESIVTVPDYTTGTISVSNGGTTVTGSGTNFQGPSVQGNVTPSFIQFSGANDWYGVSSVNSTTSLTIDTAYQGTTLSGATYIYRRMYYNLSANCDRIVDVRNWTTPLKLVQVDPRTIDDLRPNPQSTNSSYGYMTWGIDSTGRINISPYPFPSDARVFEVRTIRRPTDGSVSIPNKYAHVIAWGATSIAWAYKKNLEMAGGWSAKFEQRVTQMRSEYRMSEDNQVILRSIDSGQRSKWIQMPEQYPAVTGG